jgi:hypothetical protein
MNENENDYILVINDEDEHTDETDDYDEMHDLYDEHHTEVLQIQKNYEADDEVHLDEADDDQ